MSCINTPTSKRPRRTHEEIFVAVHERLIRDDTCPWCKEANEGPKPHLKCLVDAAILNWRRAGK